MAAPRRFPAVSRVLRRHGFTLTQLAVVLTLLSVLVLTALPGYRQYVEGSARAAARSALHQIAERQQIYREKHGEYARTLGRLGWNSGTIHLYRDGTLSHIDTPDAIYQVRLEGRPGSRACPPGGSPQPSGYTVVAEPLRDQARDGRCGTLCLNSSGAARTSESDSSACWGG